MTLNTIFLVCAVAGGTVLVLRLILMIFGFDHGGDHGDIPHDVSGELDPGSLDSPNEVHAGSFNLLSIQSLSGFFTMFGLVGMGLLRADIPVFWTIAGAVAAGLVTAWASAMIVVVLQKLQSEPREVLANAVGQQGTVYLTIPAEGSGVVTVILQGAQRQYDAISATGEKIPTGTIVQVTGVRAGKLLVSLEGSTVNQ